MPNGEFCRASDKTSSIVFTGCEVMQESIQAAMTVVRARADKLGINGDFYEKRDMHVHLR